MDQVHVIRHKVLVEGRSARQVARELGISRRTVRKYLTETVPKRTETQPRGRPVWDAVRARVDGLLVESIQWTGGKQRLTATRLHELLVAEGQARFLLLRAENTKTDEPRTMPVSPRLRAVLEMRRTDPDGEELGPDTHVFGNEVGERQDSIKVAWTGTLRRAGISGLTFHDLRREYGSRLVEGGVNLLTVSRLLGHARVSTTDTYLRASELLAEKELQQFHERADRNNPRITPRRKSKPPVEGKARPAKTQKSSTSRSVS